MTTLATPPVEKEPKPGTEAYKLRLMDDFVFFSKEVWRIRRRDKLHPLTDLEFDMMRWIANGPMYGGPSRRGILGFRFLSKTNLGTINYTLWRWYRNPETRIIIVSKTQGFARRAVRDIRHCLMILPFMRYLNPGVVKTKKELDTMDRFDLAGIKTTANPSLMAIGYGGQMEGSRADVVIADDVETRGNTKTPMLREELNDYVREFSNVATFGDREIIYFGTYHHEDSVYLKLAARGYEFRTYPLLAPHPKHQILNLAPYVKQKIDDGTLKPCSDLAKWDGDCVAGQRFDPKYIQEKVQEGDRNFAMQHMLLIDVGESMRHPLKLGDLILWNVDRDEAPLTLTYGKFRMGPHAKPRYDGPMFERPSATVDEDIVIYHRVGDDNLYRPVTFSPEILPYTGTKAGLDPSQGGDPMGLSIVSHLNGFLYIKLCKAFPGVSNPENLQNIVMHLRLHRVDELHIETNNGGDAIARLIEPYLMRFAVNTGGEDEAGNRYERGWHCAVQLIHNTGQKEARILDTLAPISQIHRLVIDESVVRQKEFQRQWTMITRDRNCLGEDDMIDSLAIAIKPWSYEMAIDSEASAERQRQEVFDEELARMQGRDRRKDGARFWRHF